MRSAVRIGASQGLCLPFRGLSRSGTTISLELMLGISRREAEEFSFALGVVLTPVVIFQEAHRLLKANPTGSGRGRTGGWDRLKARGSTRIGGVLR